MGSGIHLVIIDPQIDFCNPSGSLFVKGAEQDMERLTSFIERCCSKLDDIHVTLDSHHLIDIAHPAFWVDSKGNHPNPFTMISSSDLDSGKWNTFRPSLYKRALDYTKKLEKGGRYPLVVWPPHCLIGSHGHEIVPNLLEAMNKWCIKQGGIIDFVTKGSNIYTEHYSAVRAEVPDPHDPTTQVNTRFIQTLLNADEILLSGEAGSHCLANTVRDIVQEFKDDSLVKKMCLLIGAFSPVPTFEKLQDDFLDEVKSKGIRIEKVENYLS